jgi:hypothetical protein
MARGMHLGGVPAGDRPGRAPDAMPPTGRSFEAGYRVCIHRVHGGRIAGHAGTRDDLLMLGLPTVIKPVSEVSRSTRLTPVPGHPPEPA